MNEEDRVELDSGLRCNLDGAIGGTYKLPDGRYFWVDAATVREVMARIEPIIVSWLEANTRADAPTAPAQDEPMLTAGEEDELVARINGNPNLHPVQDDDAEWLRDVLDGKPHAPVLDGFRSRERLERIANRLSADHTGVMEEALKPFEKAESECPFSGSRTPPSDHPCSRCAATSNEGCRLQTIAAYAVVDSLRTIAARGDQSPDASGGRNDAGRV